MHIIIRIKDKAAAAAAAPVDEREREREEPAQDLSSRWPFETRLTTQSCRLIISTAAAAATQKLASVKQCIIINILLSLSSFSLSYFILFIFLWL